MNTWQKATKVVEKLISEGVSVALVGDGNPKLGSKGSDYFRDKNDVIQLKHYQDFSWPTPGHWYIYYSGYNGRDQHMSAMLVYSDTQLRTFADPYGDFKKHQSAIEINKALTEIDPEWDMADRGTGAGSLKKISQESAARILKRMGQSEDVDTEDMALSGDLMGYGDELMPGPKDLEGTGIDGSPRHPWT